MNGKIQQKELINRIQDSETKECIGFEYILNLTDEKGRTIPVVFYFKRLDEPSRKIWQIKFISEFKMIGELKAYCLEYEIPIRMMALEMIAAIGLRQIQYMLKMEIEFKSMIDFTIGDETSNM